MKKLFTLFLSVALIVCMSLAATSCGESEPPNDDDGTIKEMAKNVIEIIKKDEDEEETEE